MKIVVSWTEIENTDGKYHVSSDGRVKSHVRYKEGKILAQNDDGRGYKTICIKGRRFYVHRLVAQAFLPNLKKLPQVNHIDGNKSNNALVNLEWCTPSQNAKHKYASGLASQKGMANTSRKLSWDDVLLIRASKLSCRKIAKVYNLNKDHVSRIRTRKVWDYENYC